MRSRNNPDGWQPSDAAMQRHDRYILDRINAVVKPGDILWHLGDFCFGPPSRIRQYAGLLRDQIECRTINLIWGNHDRHEIAPLFNRHYVEYTGKIQSQRFYAHHIASAIWYGSHAGGWNLYGHSHGTAEDYLDKILPNRRSIDAGIDNAFRVLGEYRPFSFDELSQILNARTGISIEENMDKRRADSWDDAYERWQKDCLAAYNERFREHRALYAIPEGEYDPGDLVEFGENGAAYPHGAGGINYIPNAVAPWTESEHYRP